MKKAAIILLALLLCFTATACSDKPDTEELNSAMDEMKDEVENLRGAVVGKWRYEISLAEALSEAHHSVWDKNMAGTYAVTVKLTNDGAAEITCNDTEFEEALRTYFLSEEYSEDAAAIAVTHYGEPLKLSEKLTYTYNGGIVKLSNGTELVLSKDGLKLAVKASTVETHEYEGETCETYENLIGNVEFERVD